MAGRYNKSIRWLLRGENASKYIPIATNYIGQWNSNSPGVAATHKTLPDKTTIDIYRAGWIVNCIITTLNVPLLRIGRLNLALLNEHDRFLTFNVESGYFVEEYLGFGNNSSNNTSLLYLNKNNSIIENNRIAKYTVASDTNPPEPFWDAFVCSGQQRLSYFRYPNYAPSVKMYSHARWIDLDYLIGQSGWINHLGPHPYKLDTKEPEQQIMVALFGPTDHDSSMVSGEFFTYTLAYSNPYTDLVNADVITAKITANMVLGIELFQTINIPVNNFVAPEPGWGALNNVSQLDLRISDDGTEFCILFLSAFLFSGGLRTIATATSYITGTISQDGEGLFHINASALSTPKPFMGSNSEGQYGVTVPITDTAVLSSSMVAIRDWHYAVSDGGCSEGCILYPHSDIMTNEYTMSFSSDMHYSALDNISYDTAVDYVANQVLVGGFTVNSSVEASRTSSKSGTGGLQLVRGCEGSYIGPSTGSRSSEVSKLVNYHTLISSSATVNDSIVFELVNFDTSESYTLNNNTGCDPAPEADVYRHIDLETTINRVMYADMRYDLYILERHIISAADSDTEDTIGTSTPQFSYFSYRIEIVLIKDGDETILLTDNLPTPSNFRLPANFSKLGNVNGPIECTGDELPDGCSIVNPTTEGEYTNTPLSGDPCFYRDFAHYQEEIFALDCDEDNSGTSQATMLNSDLGFIGSLYLQYVSEGYIGPSAILFDRFINNIVQSFGEGPWSTHNNVRGYNPFGHSQRTEQPGAFDAHKLGHYSVTGCGSDGINYIAYIHKNAIMVGSTEEDWVLVNGELVQPSDVPPDYGNKFKVPPGTEVTASWIG